MALRTDKFIQIIQGEMRCERCGRLRIVMSAPMDWSGERDTSATEGVGMASGVASEHSGWRCMRVTGVVMILKEQ